MEFSDITHDTQTLYRLKENERRVFFLLNRSGDITIELTGIGAEAHVFAFFIGRNTEKSVLTITQKHRAPHTTSRVLVKSVLDDAASFSYHGTLHITPEATKSDASQENRNLLLAPEAKAVSEPILEILTNDVRCHHAATTSPLNQDLLFFAEARGLSKSQARTLLVSGFLRSSLEELSALAPSEDSEKMLALMGKIA